MSALIGPLHHVGVAVADMEEALRLYREDLGGELVGRGRMEDEQMDFALVSLRGSEVELMHSPVPESPLGRFLARRGPGLHHVAFQVEDLEGAVRGLVAAGREPAGGVRAGVHGRRVAFFHPRSMGGVLTELVEGG
ncbi:MAG: VOC family protein [Candidatus Dormibacterales bacterium]